MNNKFFTKKETESKSRPDGKIYSCISCGLQKKCTNPKMEPFGNFKKGILNIGEAPGEIKDQRGKPWQGKTGKLLERTYKELGIDLFEDCLNINAVNCQPTDEAGNNRPPTNYEVECCRASLLKIISEYKPKVINLFGNTALYSLIGHRWKKDLGTISKWRGFTIPDQDFNAWICPMFHPSYIERSFFASVSNRKQTSVEETIWIQDLKQSIELLSTQTYENKEFLLHPFPKYVEPKIEIIEDLSILTQLKKVSEIAFDYETTGLKPHAYGHRIICCAIADSSDHAFVFMMPQTRNGRQPFVDVLADPSIGKMAHNMKFEEAWSVVRLKQPVQNWIWDSMLCAHILDNRPGITGLKFQAYINFGIVDYSSEIAPYLSAEDDTNDNSLNRIGKLLTTAGGIEKLLHYCALDAVYEYRLAKKQQMEFLPF
jgi:DNA polymerase